MRASQQVAAGRGTPSRRLRNSEHDGGPEELAIGQRAKQAKRVRAVGAHWPLLQLADRCSRPLWLEPAAEQ